jgi:hypothetical protein
MRQEKKSESLFVAGTFQIFPRRRAQDGARKQSLRSRTSSFDANPRNPLLGQRDSVGREALAARTAVARDRICSGSNAIPLTFAAAV